MSTQTPTLQVAVEEQERCRRRMTVTVPSDHVQARQGNITKDLSSRLKLPGFRKGRIPASVVQQRFGEALRRETLDKVISEAYKAALAQEELHPVGEGEVEDVQFQEGEDLVFSIAFDVQPVIELHRLGGFSVERPPAVIGDHEVEAVMQRLREQAGTWAPVEEGAAQAGDLVSIEIVRLDGEGGPSEAQPYELIVGEADAIPDVEEAIKTLAPGDSGEFLVTFPEDFPDEERRGEERRLLIELKSRKGRELPELDDEFARTLGDFADLATLHEKVRGDLEKEATDRAESTVRGQLLDLVLDANAFDVPQSMVDRYITGLMSGAEGVDEERLAEARTSLQGDAERAVRRILAIEEVAVTQELKATEEELDERVEAMAKSHDSTPAKVYASLQKAGRLESLEREITEGKVFEFLKAQSEVTEAS